MLPNILLNDTIQKFISDNLETPIAKLSFLKNPFPDVDYKLLLNQIEGKKKAKTKLPTWFETEKIIYPSKISLEQTSSEITANYKSKIVKGTTLLDASGGFGIDDYYFSKHFKNVIHCEIQPDLSAVVQHNFNQLQISNCEFVSENSTDYLLKNAPKVEVIYIDPSRRNADKKKVFFLEDCEPNVPELLDFYYQFTDVLLLKVSPLLDISAAIKSLKNVSEVHILATQNDVKEVVFKVERNSKKNPAIKTRNFTKNGTEIVDFEKSNPIISPYSLPQKYLYEPNNAIMKSGKFEEIPNYFEVLKLHVNSHLYTNNSLIDFPGRVFEIQQEIEYNKTELKKYLVNKQANITVRNFPESVENIRKKWKIKDGGNLYCFFTTNKKNAKIVLLCTKLK